MRKNLARNLVFAMLSAAMAGAQTATIQTIAGGYIGDGGPATQAGLYSVRNIAYGPDGTLYIPDLTNNRLRRVTPDGVITTVAGNGNAAFTGDGGPANLASLWQPEGVAVDSKGRIYIAEVLNDRIRRIDTNGVISTIAGNGNSSGFQYGVLGTTTSAGYPRSLYIDSTDTIYVADRDFNRVYKIDSQTLTLSLVAGTGNNTSTGDFQPATNATLNAPYGVAVDNQGNIYISEQKGNRIRRIDKSGIITTICGDGTSGYNGDNLQATSARLAAPTGLWANGGDLYIADTNNSRIRRIRGGVITTVVGTGIPGFSGDGAPAVSAQLQYPWGVRFDPNGNLAISDTGNAIIRVVDKTTGTIQTVAGTSTPILGTGGAAIGAYLFAPFGMVFDPSGSGSIIFTDAAAQGRLWIMDKSGLISTLSGGGAPGTLGDGGPASMGGLQVPSGLAVDKKGAYYIADFGNSRIRKIDSKGIITTFAGSAQGYSGDGGLASQAKLNGPLGVAVHPSTGEVYFSDSINNCVRKVDSNGIVSTYAGICTKSGFSGDGLPARSALLNFPSALLFDPAGNLFISDQNNFRIRRVDATLLTISTYAGNGDTLQNLVQNNHNLPAFGQPATQIPFENVTGMFFDSTGNLYVSQNYFLVKIDATTKAVSQLAGSCNASYTCYGFSGDGGPATQARFNGQAGILVDSVGTIYFADSYNGRLRSISSRAATSNITLQTQPAGLNVLADGRQFKDGDKLSWIPGSSHQLSVPATQVTAAGDTRYVFTGWSTGAGTQALQLSAPGGAATYTAIFKTQYQLAVTVAGSGVVAASPQSSDGGFYDAGTAVQLSAAPNSGWTFTGFSNTPDGGITMSGPQAVVATFAAPLPDLSVTPGILRFNVQQGGASAPAVLVSIASTGSPLSFGVSPGEGYVTASVAQNTTPAVARVSINPSGLAAGTYQSNVTIAADGASPITVPVNITVSPVAVKPDLIIAPGVVNLSVTAGTQSSTRSLALTSSASPIRVGWNVKSGSQWLLVQADQNNTTTPATLNLTFSPSGLAPGSYTGRIEVTSTDASTATADQVILVNFTVEAAAAAPVQLLPSVTGLTFQMQQQTGGAITPAPPPQTLAIASSPANTLFYPTASVSTSSPWLHVTTPTNSNSATAPVALTVSVDPTVLTAPGSYGGSIDLRTSPSGDVVARVPVEFDIAAPVVAPNLTTDRTPVQFQLPAGSAAAPVVWKIQNPSGASVPISVQSIDGASWLSATPNAVAAASNSPALIEITADATSLAPGTYASSLQASAGSTTLTLPVTLTVTSNSATLIAVQKSLTVTGTGGSLISRNINLATTGSAAVSWQATSSAPWLFLRTPSGTINPNSTDSISILIDSTQFPVGVDQSATITVTSPQTANPEVITVTATTYSANQPPYLNTAGVVFVSQAGGAAPPPSTVTVTYPNQFNVKATLLPADSWIQLATTSIQTDGLLGQASFGISVAPGSLAPGVYRSFVFVNFGGSTALNLSVVLVVTGPSGNSIKVAANGKTSQAIDGGGCTPTRYIPVFASDIYGLHLRLGDTANTDFVVVDDCGNLLTNGGVSTNFSTGDRPADLSQVTPGVWRASWVPKLGASANGIQLSVAAVSPAVGLPVGVPDLQPASIAGTSNAPLLDYQTPFLSPDLTTPVLVTAPGSRVLINGTNLSPVTIQSANGATTLGNTSVTIGGVPMVLMAVSPTQIDALVPAGIGTDVMQSVVVSNSGNLSAPERIAVADSWPLIVTAGVARRGGIDVVLTGVSAKDTPKTIVIRSSGTDCKITQLQAIRKEQGLYYAHLAGCAPSAGQRMETYSRQSTIGGSVVQSQAVSVK